MHVAYGEVGVKAFPEGQSNPRVTAYHKGTNITGYDDKAAWCSSFVNWVFNKVGIHGTNSALARSWLEWGVRIDFPVKGCVVVLEREGPNGWKGHVGFYVKTEGERIYLFGGNQLNEVREYDYDVSTVLAYRWPEAVKKVKQ